MRSLVFGAVAVLSAVTLSACADNVPVAGGESAPVPVGPAATSAAPKAAAKPAVAKVPTSDLGELKKLGIDVGKSVLIDVADDGQDRWLEVGKNGVDFTGTSRTDSTMMFLAAAPVTAKNRVLIKPPFYNEDLGSGYCVADTKGAPLKLEGCQAGRKQQVFTIVPAGDSGQFELHGMYGVIRVNNGKITTSGEGRTGLQTILYAN
ncbi:hypothetical protein [Actinoplanes regularis]|uniref:hypothetical protein n=1 Tax=Actinoplanes regularis TaxID=52697 RepID=UPI0024A1D9E4|nr:hypothetical protein [Actinoplanes regularis]GLW30041.1 hypothetical protein Areg01_29810 [Actinoplanes regularis]